MKLNINEKHEYVLDCPSVSALVDWAVGKKDYSTVDQEILKKAQIRGNHVHSMLETVLEKQRFIKCCEVKNHEKIVDQILEILEPLKDHKNAVCEQKLYSVEYKFTGAIDLYLEDINNKQRFIIDYKTSSKVDIERWTWQLNYYRLLLEGYSSAEEVQMFVIHSNGKTSKAQLIEVEYIEDQELINNINDYYEWNEGDRNE